MDATALTRGLKHARSAELTAPSEQNVARFNGQIVDQQESIQYTCTEKINNGFETVKASDRSLKCRKCCSYTTLIVYCMAVVIGAFPAIVAGIAGGITLNQKLGEYSAPVVLAITLPIGLSPLIVVMAFTACAYHINYCAIVAQFLHGFRHPEQQETQQLIPLHRISHGKEGR